MSTGKALTKLIRRSSLTILDTQRVYRNPRGPNIPPSTSSLDWWIYHVDVKRRVLLTCSTNVSGSDMISWRNDLVAYLPVRALEVDR